MSEQKFHYDRSLRTSIPLDYCMLPIFSIVINIEPGRVGPAQSKIEGQNNFQDEKRVHLLEFDKITMFLLTRVVKNKRLMESSWTTRVSEKLACRHPSSVKEQTGFVSHAEDISVESFAREIEIEYCCL